MPSSSPSLSPLSSSSSLSSSSPLSLVKSNPDSRLLVPGVLSQYRRCQCRRRCIASRCVIGAIPRTGSRRLLRSGKRRPAGEPCLLVLRRSTFSEVTRFWAADPKGTMSVPPLSSLSCRVSHVAGLSLLMWLMKSEPASFFILFLNSLLSDFIIQILFFQTLILS